MPNEKPLRAGRTLPELLVALTVSGILFALLTSAFITHQRLVSGSTAIAESRGQARQAHEIIPAILRGTAAAVGDLHAAHDTLLDLAYPIAAGVACLSSVTNQVTLAPDSIANGQHFTSWTHRPRPGDLAHVFDPGALPTATDDRWWTAAVSSLAAAPNGCVGSPLLDPVADAVHSARVLSLGPWVGAIAPSIVPAGAVVHFTRRTRALLYAASGSDYLGVSDLDPTLGRWSVVQPVSGPYATHAGVPGLQFQLLDSLGAVLPFGPSPVPSGVSVVTLSIRSRSATQVRVAGMRRGLRSESLSAHIALRNR
ncbi:MAG: PilW family protein [Gemmatimonadaceae bacterium]